MLSNGMTQTNDLDLYLREDLTRYGLRLEEAAKKLKQAIADMVGGLYECSLIEAVGAGICDADLSCLSDRMWTWRRGPSKKRT